MNMSPFYGDGIDKKIESAFRDRINDWLEDKPRETVDAINVLLKHTHQLWYGMVIGLTYNEHRIREMSNDRVEAFLRFLQLLSPMGTMQISSTGAILPYFQNEIMYGSTIHLVDFDDYNVHSLKIRRKMRYARIVGPTCGKASIEDVTPLLETLIDRAKGLTITLRTDFFSLPYDDWDLFKWTVDNYNVVARLIPLLKNTEFDESGSLIDDPAAGEDKLRSKINLDVLRKVSYNDMKVLCSILDSLADRSPFAFYNSGERREFDKLRRFAANVLVNADASRVHGLASLLKYLRNHKNIAVRGDLVNWLGENIEMACRLPENIVVEDLEAEYEPPHLYMDVYDAAYKDGLFHVGTMGNRPSMSDSYPVWFMFNDSGYSSLLSMTGDDGSIDLRDPAVSNALQLDNKRPWAVFLGSLNYTIAQMTGESAGLGESHSVGNEIIVQSNVYTNLRTIWDRILDVAAGHRGLLSRFLTAVNRIRPYCLAYESNSILRAASKDLQSLQRACAFLEHWGEICLIMAIIDNVDSWKDLEPAFSNVDGSLSLDDLMSRYDEILHNPSDAVINSFVDFYIKIFNNETYQDHWYMRWPDFKSEDKKHRAIAPYSEWLHKDGRVEGAPTDLTAYSTSGYSLESYSHYLIGSFDNAVYTDMLSTPLEALEYIRSGKIPRTITMHTVNRTCHGKRIPPCFYVWSKRNDEIVHVLGGDPLLPARQSTITSILYDRLRMSLSRPEQSIPSDAMIVDIITEYAKMRGNANVYGIWSLFPPVSL